VTYEFNFRPDGNIDFTEGRQGVDVAFYPEELVPHATNENTFVVSDKILVDSNHFRNVGTSTWVEGFRFEPSRGPSIAICAKWLIKLFNEIPTDLWFRAT
jgi:hypothetical protein